jgi:hypothetical protein
LERTDSGLEFRARERPDVALSSKFGADDVREGLEMLEQRAAIRGCNGRANDRDRYIEAMAKSVGNGWVSKIKASGMKSTLPRGRDERGKRFRASLDKGSSQLRDRPRHNLSIRGSAWVRVGLDSPGRAGNRDRC